MLAAGLVLDRVVDPCRSTCASSRACRPACRRGRSSLRAYVSQENVDRWTRTARLPIRLALTEEGVLLTTGVGGIRMSETLADLEVAGRFLRLAPKRMTIVGLPAPMARFFRGYLPLPPLPEGRADHRGAPRRRPARGHVRARRARRAAHPRHRPPAALAHAACRSPASGELTPTIHQPRAATFLR